MAQIDMARLAEVLNREFGPPFLPKGFVRSITGMDGNTISIFIGGRDVCLDADGRVIGAGSAVGSGREWRVERIPESERPPDIPDAAEDTSQDELAVDNFGDRMRPPYDAEAPYLLDVSGNEWKCPICKSTVLLVYDAKPWKDYFRCTGCSRAWAKNGTANFSWSEKGAEDAGHA